MKINEWSVFAHECFLVQYEELTAQVLAAQRKYPNAWQKKNVAKRLAVITHLVTSEIPNDPTRDIYRQGNTLGADHKGWLRAKFYQQYRLFFRYHSGSKTILYGWVNGPQSKRAYGSKTDAYKVFERMLEKGNPPNSWNDLLKASVAEDERFRRLLDDDL